jgi:hypothetical protein
MLAMMAMFSFLYISLDRGHTEFFSFGSSNIADSNHITTMNIINTAWIWLPGAVLFSFLIWNITKPSKERQVFR